MLIIIKSGPDTAEGKRALKLAEDMKAGVCLMQNGVYFCRQDVISSLSGKVYSVDEDMKLRGIVPCGGVQSIGYSDAIDLMAENDKVAGMF